MTGQVHIHVCYNRLDDKLFCAFLFSDDYFSAECMKERDPLLYQQLIGQYLTDEEVNEQVEGRDLSMSAIMMQHVQAIANTELYNKLCDIEVRSNLLV